MVILTFIGLTNLLLALNLFCLAGVFNNKGNLLPRIGANVRVADKMHRKSIAALLRRSLELELEGLDVEGWFAVGIKNLPVERRERARRHRDAALLAVA